MPVREWAYVALGSNVGNRAAHLAHARARLAALPQSELVLASAIEETAPLGPPGQDPYLNQMVLLHTGLPAEALLQHCRAIERERGRGRRERWGARTLDLDIVRYGEATIATPSLTVPHPELPNRPFWQRELAALEPHAR